MLCSLNGGPIFTPFVIAIGRPSLVRAMIRNRSRSAIAENMARNPRPSGVVKSREGKSRTLIVAPACASAKL